MATVESAAGFPVFGFRSGGRRNPALAAVRLLP